MYIATITLLFSTVDAFEPVPENIKEAGRKQYNELLQGV